MFVKFTNSDTSFDALVLTPYIIVLSNFLEYIPYGLYLMSLCLIKFILKVHASLLSLKNMSQYFLIMGSRHKWQWAY